MFHAAGKVAGILGNQRFPADLICDNLAGEINVIRAACKRKVKKLLYLASSCSYPKHCAQPMKPEYLLTGALEPTNEAYAVAKIAGIKLCESHRRQHGSPFIVGIPANAFGPGDDFSPEEGHVIPALLRRFHEAKEKGLKDVVVWGTGAPRREFIYAPDLASACIFAMEKYDAEAPLNLGGGGGVSIRELAQMVKDAVGFKGELVFDVSKPDGMPVKELDSSALIALGWRAATPLSEAVAKTYAWYLANRERC